MKFKVMKSLLILGKFCKEVGNHTPPTWEEAVIESVKKLTAIYLYTLGSDRICKKD